ncbi:MAG TPA: RNA-binding protein [Candidatus Binatia bacterium]|nr:RNA-binding protein [Candidatus Binatia bacterium]
MAKLYVGNLAYEVTDDGLQQVFAGKGFQVASARVIRDADTGRSRGFGFVELNSNEDATRAITELHGASLEGRALQVNEARPQAPRGDRGGSGRDAGRGRRRY